MRYVFTLIMMILLGGASVVIVVHHEHVIARIDNSAADGSAGHVLFDPGTAPPGTPPILWPAPTFSLPDQNNDLITDQTLRGHPWIADFIFTTCTTACPVMTAHMRLLQRELTDPALRFVSFSVDPEHDTVPALKAYETLWHGDTQRWYLLNTTIESLAAVSQGMHVSFRHTADPFNPIMHSSTFLLIDAAGNVRGVYDSQDEIALKQLVADAQAIGGANNAAATSLANDKFATPNPFAGLSTVDTSLGKSLYMSVGCMACHEQARIAPRLEGVFGSTVALDDGSKIAADTAYLRESIVDPGAKIVVGYGHTMPAYKDHLTATQIDALVAFIETLKTNPATENVAFQAVDPVCHMHVTVVPGESNPSAVYNGKTFYFCSQGCHDKFIADPKKYATATVDESVMPDMGDH
jgi:protein SCO1/2